MKGPNEEKGRKKKIIPSYCALMYICALFMHDREDSIIVLKNKFPGT